MNSQSAPRLTLALVDHTPDQRAFAAGYLLAGDLSKGGIIAELLYGGVGIGSSSAITWVEQ